MSHTERQRELIETYQAVQREDLPFVLVGGWAVSAFQSRFTTDVDMVISEVAVDQYTNLLADRGYTKEFDTDISNVYQGRIVRYEKAVGENTVQFDALVEALRCRQTDAEWSYRYLAEYSVVESLSLAEGLEARIPEPALLFALKLHSGRLTDARDLVLMTSHTDFDRIERHLHRGDSNALKQQIQTVKEKIRSDGFIDSLKCSVGSLDGRAATTLYR
ncbi:hypothetical protein OB920_15695 [Halobacteria archaeon HArc-gm2]|nr:hypothetical protein [Halobacteria archaeon HArc-gm2]